MTGCGRLPDAHINHFDEKNTINVLFEKHVKEINYLMNAGLSETSHVYTMNDLAPERTNKNNNNNKMLSCKLISTTGITNP